MRQTLSQGIAQGVGDRLSRACLCDTTLHLASQRILLTVGEDE